MNYLNSLSVHIHNQKWPLSVSEIEKELSKEVPYWRLLGLNYMPTEDQIQISISEITGVKTEVVSKLSETISKFDAGTMSLAEFKDFVASL